MSVLRIRSAQVFAELVSQACPELAHICAGPSTAESKRKFPSLAIIPIKHKISLDQEDEWEDVGDTGVVLFCGRYDSLFQLKVGGRSPEERAKIAHDITQLFFQREGSPGLIVRHIADCHQAIVGYELGDESWKDEAGFSDKWFSIQTINVVTPILVERGAVHTMQEIRTCVRAYVAESFESLATLPQECVAVDEDGNVTISSLTP